MNDQTERTEGSECRAALALMAETAAQLMEGQMATKDLPEGVRRAAWCALMKPVQVAAQVFTLMTGSLTEGEVLSWLEEFAKKNAEGGEGTAHARMSRILVECVMERTRRPELAT